MARKNDEDKFLLSVEISPVLRKYGKMTAKEHWRYLKTCKNKFHEENIWKLCEKVKNDHPSELCYCYSVFISNTDRVIPLWYQKASKSPDGNVVWDYHVICVYAPPDQPALVYDLDTTLPFPCEFKKYATAGIKDDRFLKPQYHRNFRVVPAPEYLEKFASDRSHMLNAENKWMSDPPVYPCIQTEEIKNNIQDFISMDSSVGYGSVLSSSEFLERFGDLQKT